ncbi:MAG: hypothetical protein II442_04255, partial [Oscillospiraceae bacterium]|nr:hypothetical protein [Oscillospiraceae bacterium]
MMPLLITALLLLAGVTAAFVSHVIKERRRTDEAAEIVRRMADGDPAARLECSGEGSRARLYHEINSLASVLGAHADAELQAKVFLKNSIQDISHQLKTPLASLSIYQELLADETLDSESRQHFQALSAQEFERMELLVQNLLKIRKDVEAVTVHSEEGELIEYWSEGNELKDNIDNNLSIAKLEDDGLYISAVSERKSRRYRPSPAA